jgi:hypothetical protein
VATYTQVLGLKLNQSADPFMLSDFVSNWTLLDASPGLFICTSVTLPAWTSAQAGRCALLTDWECVLQWNGTTWIDNRNAAPVLAAGTVINQSVAHNSSSSFTVMNFTLPRSCTLVIQLTGTYYVQGNGNQDIYQRVLVNGVGATGNQMGGYREQLRMVAPSGTSETAGGSVTTFQVAASLTAGSGTIGLGVDVGTLSNQAVIVVGAKVLAFVSATSPSNSL